MKVTNRNNWPEAIVRAIEQDDYDRGICDYTVTELISPPRILALKRLHKDEIIVDAEDMIYALEGKILHKLLEHANRAGLVEKRFFATVAGKVISAQIDTLSWEIAPKEKKIDGQTVLDAEWILSDWKYSTRYKFQPNRIDPDWAAQLNVQGYLLRKAGLQVDRQQVIGIAKDHSKIQAELNPKYFPKKAVTKMEIPVWSIKKTEAFIAERIEIHERAIHDLPECEPGEHWQRKRCAHYCNVSKFCDNWIKEAKLEP